MEVSLSGVKLLRSLLHQTLTIKLTDGRILIGHFLCVDRDANIIIGSAAEYPNDTCSGEPRILGLAMIRGRHIISIKVKKSDIEVA